MGRGKASAGGGWPLHLTERVARAACDHEQACDKIARGSQSPGLYADEGDCIQEFELTAQRTVESCVGPVESTRIEPCLEDISAAHCGILSFDHFERCQAAYICCRRY